MTSKIPVTPQLKKILRQKKRQAYMKLVLPVSASFINGCIPKPLAEVPGELATEVIDIVIFIDIWQLYFERDVSTDDVIALMKEVGILKSTGTVLTFTALKVADGLINEFGNILGPAGWLIEGILSGSLSLIAGYMWTKFCEKLYIEHGAKFSEEVVSKEATRFNEESVSPMAA